LCKKNIILGLSSFFVRDLCSFRQSPHLASSFPPKIATMQQAKEVTRKRPAEAPAAAAKRLKADVEKRPSLTQLLSRKSKLEPQLPLSQTSEDSDVPLARLAAQQKAKRASTAVAARGKTQQLCQPGKSRGKTNEQGEDVFELSTKRRVTVRKWKAMKFVDIREFYDDDGEVKPGKKGGGRWCT
jgi:hypothetical protein